MTEKNEMPDMSLKTLYRRLQRANDRIRELQTALSHYACCCKEDKCTPEEPRYRNIKCGWPARQALGEKKNDASTGPTNTGYNT